MSDINNEFVQLIARATEQDQKSMMKHILDECGWPKDISIRFPVRECSTIHLTGWTVRYKTETLVTRNGKSLNDYTLEGIETVSRWIRNRILRQI